VKTELWKGNKEKHGQEENTRDGCTIGKDKGKGNRAMKDKSRKTFKASEKKKLMLRYEVYETFHS